MAGSCLCADGDEFGRSTDAHGVEWFGLTNPRGQVRKRRFPLVQRQTRFLGKQMDGCEKLGEEEKTKEIRKISDSVKRKRKPSPSKLRPQPDLLLHPLPIPLRLFPRFPF